MIGRTCTKLGDHILKLDADIGSRDGHIRRCNCITSEQATDDGAVLDDIVVFTTLNADEQVLEVDAELGSGNRHLTVLFGVLLIWGFPRLLYYYLRFLRRSQGIYFIY